MRVICWFSCGAASAVATKLALNMYKDEEVVIAYTHVENEHPDSMRFLKECEEWFGQKIVILKDGKYGGNVDNVIEQRRYMSGVQGAPCTLFLKKEVRKRFQKHDDLHVFGFDTLEEHRVDQLIDAEPTLKISTPLIDKGYSKQYCFQLLQAQGIELPEMYKLGYHNNNCIGCVKAGGAGYWNKIRQDFPEVFNRRARQEELLGVSLVKMSLEKLKRDYPATLKSILDEELQTGREILKQTKNGQVRVPLRHLPPTAGNHKDLDFGSCGFLCELIE